eukprot:TRINITY_DN3816_c0_g4_i3.p2 TRINITY_DN3816_c0_g4~~TRINITY_DN3816_c0_g4_i3.p2  ORF type:complete len:193 (+),score=58.54 TRINITY_DN3816_c0_g4_i3:70-648(+)
MKSSLLLVLCAAMVISQKDGGGAFGHALSDLEHTQDISPVDGEEGHGIQQAETDVLAKIRTGQHTKKTSNMKAEADEAPADEEHRDEGENATGKQHTSLSVESLVKAGAASGATVDVKEKQAEETSESSSSSSMSWLYGLAGGVGALCIGTAIALTVYSKRRASAIDANDMEKAAQHLEDGFWYPDAEYMIL